MALRNLKEFMVLNLSVAPRFPPALHPAHYWVRFLQQHLLLPKESPEGFKRFLPGNSQEPAEGSHGKAPELVTELSSTFPKLSLAVLQQTKLLRLPRASSAFDDWPWFTDDQALSSMLNSCCMLFKRMGDNNLDVLDCN